MNTRKACIEEIKKHMEQIAKLYKEAYPKADYLSMAIFVESGNMNFNNNYSDEDVDYPIALHFDKDAGWYEYH